MAGYKAFSETFGIASYSEMALGSFCRIGVLGLL